MTKIGTLLMTVPMLLVASAAMAQKTSICHVPPGNPGNAHTISVAPNAVPAHLAHGDSMGACECRVDADCADDNLCNEERCVLGKCQREELPCADQPCVENSVCLPDTGECLGDPVECAEGSLCDPSADECKLCGFRISISTPNPDESCPDAGNCLECCHDAIPGNLDPCEFVNVVIDQFPDFCSCMGCNCDGP